MMISRKTWFGVFALFLTSALVCGPFVPAPAYAQGFVQDRSVGPILLSVPGVAAINTQGSGTTVIQVTGTGAGMAGGFQATNDGVNWYTINAIVIATGASVSTISGNGQWSIPTAGYAQVRVNLTAISGGTAGINLETSVGAGGGGSSGGSSGGISQLSAACSLTTSTGGVITGSGTITGDGLVYTPTTATSYTIQVTDCSKDIHFQGSAQANWNLFPATTYGPRQHFTLSNDTLLYNIVLTASTSPQNYIGPQTGGAVVAITIPPQYTADITSNGATLFALKQSLQTGTFPTPSNYGGITANNAWTGTNTFTTQAANDNSTKAASTAYVDAGDTNTVVVHYASSPYTIPWASYPGANFVQEILHGAGGSGGSGIVAASTSGGAGGSGGGTVNKKYKISDLTAFGGNCVITLGLGGAQPAVGAAGSPGAGSKLVCNATTIDTVQGGGGSAPGATGVAAASGAGGVPGVYQSPAGQSATNATPGTATVTNLAEAGTAGTNTNIAAPNLAASGGASGATPGAGTNGGNTQDGCPGGGAAPGITTGSSSAAGAGGVPLAYYPNTGTSQTAVQAGTSGSVNGNSGVPGTGNLPVLTTAIQPPGGGGGGGYGEGTGIQAGNGGPGGECAGGGGGAPAFTGGAAGQGGPGGNGFAVLVFSK